MPWHGTETHCMTAKRKKNSLFFYFIFLSLNSNGGVWCVCIVVHARLFFLSFFTNCYCVRGLFEAVCCLVMTMWIFGCVAHAAAVEWIERVNELGIV